MIPRGGRAEDIRWFFGGQRSIVHTANAWQEGDTVVMDAPMADGNTWPWFEDVDGAPFLMNGSTLRRLTFDLSANSDQVRETILFNQDITSFTRIDDRWTTRANRYVFVQYVDPSQPFDARLPDDTRLRPVNSYARFDVIEGGMKSYHAGSHHVLQEPTFVPRSAHAPEGDGYLLGTVHDLTEMRSELVIVDAVSMTECARIILPFRNPYQVHGVWASNADLPLT